MNIVRRKEVLALFIGDIAVFIVSLYLALTLRFGELPTGAVFLTHFLPFFVLFLISILIHFIVGLYEKHTLILKSKLPVMLIRVQITNAILAVAFFYFIPYLYITPKIILFIYLVVSLILMVTWRMAIAETLGQRRGTKALLIARKSTEASDLYHEINNNQRNGINFVEWIHPEASPLTSEEIMQHVSSKKISLIVADFTDQKVHELMPTLYRLIFSGVQFADIQNTYEDLFDRVPLSLVNDTWFLENVSSSTKISFDIFKRIMDIVVSGIVGIISLIFYPFVYIAMKIEDNGVLFSYQERIGQNNKTIRIVKFRTMSNANDGGKWGKVENKVTKVGNILRKTRIDELPQLWNVFKGDVSLIGPRPEFGPAVEAYAAEIPYYNVRHIVKPGLSGWAQIYGKHPHHGINHEETMDKLAHDLYYIKNRGILLDLKIALQTFKVLLSFVGR
jgi:lipopolysaccharide/colanic/teichoic acid biosynthesis glycosyltransferase